MCGICGLKIPVVSTRKGAEGLADKDGEICGLSDDPRGFADCVVDLLEDREKALGMARAARAFVTEERDMQKMAERLVKSYRTALAAMRSSSPTVRSSSSISSGRPPASRNVPTSSR